MIFEVGVGYASQNQATSKSPQGSGGIKEITVKRSYGPFKGHLMMFGLIKVQVST